MSRNMHLILGIVALFSTVVWLGSGLGNAQSETPLPPPAMTATAMAPTPTAEPPLSPEAEKALRHISEREGIAVADLLVVNEHPVTYPLLGRSFQLVTILDIRTGEGQEYALLVDLTDGAIEEDIEAIKEAEQAAMIAKYGKLHPTLYERLQEAEEDERLPVAIWLTAGPETTTRSDIFNILIAQYPQAAQAIEKWGEPWAVDDPELSREIHEAYYQLRDESVSQRVAPLATELRDKYGIDVTTYPGMASVSATLTKQLIESIAARPDVASLYLIEEQGTQTMDTVAWADRAPAVWRAGYDGNGRRIATIDFNAISDQVSCLDIASTVNPGLPVEAHNTDIASVASCNSTLYPGIAPGAQLVDAGFATSGNQQENAVQALEQALVNHNADTAVTSVIFGYDLTVNWTDRAFDYWAREEDVLIAVAMGNEKNNPDLYPGSPAKGWNVLTVGGSDHRQTAYWADDDFAEGGGDIDSAYKNPNSDDGDREKPEVVAPAWDITMHSIDDFGNPAIATASGTSLAAPQVGGLAALLLERNGGLAYSAPALRSIIMATALHNVDGPTGIPTSQELKDGAGAIDAALADQVAQTQGANGGTCNSPCWWNVPTSNLSPPVGGSLNNYFRASRGERIRVVINWWSNADGPGTNYSRDELDTNYDLYVYAPDGTTLLGHSASYDNNYELVDFVATQTGTYRIRLYRSTLDDNNEASNEVGIAWVKDATYLPDLRNNEGGWLSRFFLRNDDAEYRKNFRVNYFTASGTPPSKPYDTWVLDPNQVSGADAAYASFPWGTSGAAIVAGGEDTSVVVRNTHGSPDRAFADTGLSLSPSGDPAHSVNHEMYAPAFYNRYYNWSSIIKVMNTGYNADTVLLKLVGRPGYSDHNRYYSVPANGMVTVTSAEIFGTNSWVGSVRVQGSHNLAVKLEESHIYYNYSRSYNALAAGSTALYLPSAYKNMWGLTSGVVVQNIDSNSANVTLYFYHRDGTFYTSYSLGSIEPDHAAGIWLGNLAALGSSWTGSIRIEGSRPLAAMSMIEDSSNNYYTHGAASEPHRLYILPYAANDNGGWTTGYTVQNPDSSYVDVTATYYEDSGDLVVHPDNPRTFTLAPHATQGYYQALDTFLPVGWAGSVVVEAEAPVVVIMRADSDYTRIGYNGIAR